MKIIGVAGGSGSGKTTFAGLLEVKLGIERTDILAQDNYYVDQSHRFDHDGGAVNFDHPDAIDWPLMMEHLDMLRRGQSVEVPFYDFATHKRMPSTETIHPKEFIIVDGILIYTQKELLERFDYKVFIICPEQTRFERRLRRDVVERGRTADGVRAQFMSQVKPMHDRYVEPSKIVADVLISGEEDYAQPLERVSKTVLFS